MKRWKIYLLFGCIFAGLVALRVQMDQEAKVIAPLNDLNDCEAGAFEEYNRVGILIGRDIADAEAKGNSAVNFMIAQRRLEERYCLKISACRSVSAENVSRETIYGTEFYDCLKREQVSK